MLFRSSKTGSQTMNRTPIAVGIDLGTTYSVIARLDNLGRPVTLVNAEGDKITPSVVFFDGANIVVGKEAAKALATDAPAVADCAKRDMGQRFYHKLLGGRQFPPEAIQALILDKLRRDAARMVGSVDQVVVTVPAYFDEVRRKATQDAGFMAGLKVLDIINEPTAAAIAFGFQEGFFDPQGAGSAKRNVLVYDLGGGTFDVTVMQIEGTHFRALATDGDVRLGGQDWDQRLVDYVAEEFIRTIGIDPREDPNTDGRLRRECEDAKRTLSTRLKTTIVCDYKGQSVKLEITRQKFQEMTQDLLDRTAFTTRQTLQAAGLTWQDVDRVLLTGGSTRMPAVSEMLRELSGKPPDTSVSPDEAVSHGAALLAGMLLSKQGGKRPTFEIKNVNSHSLGLVGVDPKTDRRRNVVMIPRNTVLPAAHKKVFRTQKPKQSSILMQIVEGESMSPDDCSQIGKCTVYPLPKNLPARTPIDVTFRYEENGRLAVMVSVAGKSLKHELVRDNTLTQEQLDSWRTFITSRPDAP